ncbi:CubicO group peptidase (beta-lactamase class C family) [Streptosporangium becharense]|uniref:CubicO group peptidase (Beta-lactamase class C family) n=1 Tax=Streptosporangium becharense TaxID=1816182 RepID=A0A7W9IGZ2_9ACTN|nr:serine hydrolase [Streptosporangium becharense]MBB2912580.1 CubicO group peptidase (beta-lactamase class C family) [Streptosporangium becharense]MBB5820590.1 CubicO group peptidase (beta-lactamase class C family) [Streptosporangium becharense]
MPIHSPSVRVWSSSVPGQSSSVPVWSSFVPVRPSPVPTPSSPGPVPLAPAPPAQAPPSLTRAAVDNAVARLDGLVRATMARTGIPGMAVAVVHGDRNVYLKGFGVRRVGTPGTVGPDTVFQLASLSKPLASTVVAGVVGGKAGRKAVSWDDPVAGHDPGFALKNPWVTRHVTIADLFSHRSGLPDHAGDLLEDLGYGRRYILDHLRAEPLAPFRAHYAYTNFGFTEAAVAVAKARGTTWAALSSETLYRPLGMTSTSSRFADYAEAAERAFTHVRVGGRWEPRYVRDPQAQSPAGGASSTARDMTRWMRLQMDEGRFGGRQVVDAAALQRTHVPHIVSSPPRAPGGVPGFYGLGWNVDYDDRGRLRLNHSGAFDLGAATTVTLLPTEDLGVVVLTNAAPVGAAEAVAASFFDVAEHGEVTVDWLGLFGGIFAEEEKADRSKTDYTRPPADAAPPRSGTAYTGTYANDYYGPLTVDVANGTLVMRLGPRGDRFPLRHYDGDTFGYRTSGENAVGLSGVTFTVGAGGTATRVRLEALDRTGLGVFTRR